MRLNTRGVPGHAGINTHLVMLVLVCLLPIFAIAGYAAWRTGAAYRDTATVRLSETALTIRNAIEAEIESRFTVLSTFATLWSPSGLGSRLILQGSRYDGIGLEGSIQVIEFAGRQPDTQTSEPVLAIARRSFELNAPLVSNLVRGTGPQEHRIHLALPVLDAARPRVFVLSLAPLQLIRTLQPGGERVTGILIAVTDGNGLILARSRDAEKSVGVKAPDWDRLQSVPLNGGLFEARTTEGLDTVMAYQRIKMTPGWTAVVAEPLEVFNARWQSPLAGLLLGSALATALAIVLAIHIGQLIRRPVQALAARSLAIASGDNDRDRIPEAIPPSRIREFEVLRQSFEAAEAARRENERRLHTVANAGALVFWRWSADGDLLSVEGWEKLTGMPEKDALGVSWIDLVHPDDQERVALAVGRKKNGALDYFDIEFRLRVADGRWLWVRDRGGPVLDDNGKVIQWAGVLEDIDERKQDEAQIAYMAMHDALTGLGNRVLLRDRLELATAAASRGVTSALLALDLDLFKQVNDTLGHPAGDEVLRQVARRLSECVREVDLVARIGGDEFAILQHGADQPKAAVVLAERLLATVCAPYEIDGHTVVIGVSVGVAPITCGDHAADDHMRRADKALYLAKSQGRGRIALFEDYAETVSRLG